MRYEQYNWQRTDRDAWERTYINERGDLFYIEDRHKNKAPTNQTDFDDFRQDRYAVRYRKKVAPGEEEDAELFTTMDWNEAEALLEARTQDFK